MRTFTLLCLIALLAGCNKEPVGEYFTTIEYFVDEDTNARLVAEIGNAETRLDVAVTRLVDTDIAEAIVRAKERGAVVRVVADRDFMNDPGLQMIEEAGIRPVYGDGELFYLPDPSVAGIVDSPCGFKDGVVRCPEPADSEPLENYDGVEPAGAIFRPGSFNLMSHNFFIVDVRTIWNFTRPFDGQDGPQFAFRAESERMREVLDREFTQLYGGVFSTSLDVYNGPIKSTTQENPDFNAKSYLTDRGELELRFNPQDRVTKTVIDDTYRARSSVFLVTDSLGEDFLIDALAYKARAKRAQGGDDAFEVRIIVNDAAQSYFTRDALEATGVVRYAPANIDSLPTIAIFDSLPDADGEKRPRRIHVSSQPLWRAGPFDIIRNDGSSPFCPQQTGSDCVVIHPADYFIDGNMWSLLEYRGQIHEVAEIDRFEKWFNTLWQASEAP